LIENRFALLVVDVVEVLLVTVRGVAIDSDVDAGGLELGDVADNGGDDVGDSSSPSAFLRSVLGDAEPETVDDGDRCWPRIVMASGTLVSLIRRSTRFAWK
jgi:hypothetical protein